MVVRKKHSEGLFNPDRPPRRRLIDVEGMKPEDWHRVHLAYKGFVAQVRLIVAEVESRKDKADG